MAQIIDVFIAAPSDVKTERSHTEMAVTEVSTRTRDLLNVVLHPVSWPNFLPQVTRSAKQHVQDRFSARARKCKIFVGILYQRYGTEINEERRVSGTEEEFEMALANRHEVEMLTYFREQTAGCPGYKNLRVGWHLA